MRVELCVPILCGCLLWACGARPPATPTPELRVASLGGGAYVAGCVTGDVLVAARSFSLEWWRLPADRPPEWVGRATPASPGGAAPVRGLGCVGDRVRVVRADGAEQGLEGQATVWQGAAPAGWPAVDPGAPPPEGSAWAARLADGREVLLGPWGRGTRRGDAFLDWRAVAGGVVDAAYDGEHVWAVSPHGLWRWRPGPGEALPITLPAELAGRPLVTVFRDGALVWVRDATGQGWPLDVRGPRATLAAPPGPLPRVDETLRAPLAGGARVDGTRGGQDLVLVDDDGGRRRVAIGAVHALLPLDPWTLMVGTDQAIEVWRWEDERLVRARRVALGSPTARLFAAEGGRALAVGSEYGFAVLAIR